MGLVATLLGYWRSRRDSNPRYGRTVYRISSPRRARRTSLEGPRQLTHLDAHPVRRVHHVHHFWREIPHHAPLLFGLAMVGCGGGGSPTSSAHVPVVDVAMFGDSTQAGYSALSPVPTPPAAAVQRLLQQAGLNAAVTSYGVPGSQLYQLLNGADGTGLTWSQKLASTSAAVIVDNHGINDSWLGIETPLEDYRASLVAMVEQAKAHGKVMVLETPNPIVPAAQGLRMNLPAHEAKVQAMRDVAAATGTVLCDVNQAIKDRGLVTLEWIADGVHPTQPLYEGAIAQTLAKCLAPLAR